ncbi:MAG: polyribonucleotide nucleotidyltransferase [Parcubacteria group bacterium]|nr:polyribonucleotide nucleotidyltransferase [Parcubacteria group bacterium]
MPEKTFETVFGGRPLKVTVGKLAFQTNASCFVSYGATQILATAVMSKGEKEGLDFFPLLVDYEEKMYAAGKIKGSRFIKRETQPSEEAVLSGRLIDRTIRPLFNQDMRREVQVVITVLCVDGENDPDIPSLLGAALALNISDIPWDGPVAGIRIVKTTEGQFVINPDYKQREAGKFEILVSGNGEKTIMIECGAKEAKENELLEALQYGQEQLKPLMGFLEDIRKEAGVSKLDLEAKKPDEQKEKEAAVLPLVENLRAVVKEMVEEALFKNKSTKKLRKDSLSLMAEQAKAVLSKENADGNLVKSAMGHFQDMVEEEVSRLILEKETRVDGRKLDEIRPLKIETGVLMRTHGSGLFTRGETQVLSVVTLGGPGEEQILDGMEEAGKKRYMHHYNFPGFSVGEVKPFRSASRRDIGHGALAEKALLPVIPSKADFPYTIRVVSETLSSNGSSSMGSVCGSSLALMDAGVPITKPVAGIAMGLVSDNKGKWRVFTDLQDLEDTEGGMDFKVAGTDEGVTAIQMDTKTDGLTLEMVSATLEMARDARLRILKEIGKVMKAPRPEVSQFAPKIRVLKINPLKIRDVVGPGGRVINDIIAKTGVEIEIEQDGTIYVSSVDVAGLNRACEWVGNLTKEVAEGEVYTGKITRIMEFGAFCEILPGQEGLIHISELAHQRTQRVSDVVKMGDEVKVKVIGIDDLGRINLSIRALQDAPKEGYGNERRGGKRY